MNQTDTDDDPRPDVFRPLLERLNPRQALMITYLDRGTVRSLPRLLELLDVPARQRSQNSRDFVAGSRRLLSAVNGRRLDGVRLAAIMMDGTEVGGQRIVWAQGITTDGQRLVLGLAQGPSEDPSLIQALLGDLRRRGLELRFAVRVVDGGDSMAAAIAADDPLAVTQVCVVHVARAVSGHIAAARHLPEAARRQTMDLARFRLFQAWKNPDVEQAGAALEALAVWLVAEGHAPAARSVRRHSPTTRTLQRLGVRDASVYTMLASTNLIEAPHTFVKRWKKKVGVWLDPKKDMRLRFVAAALANAELGWNRMGEPAALERLSLAVATARHPEVAVEAGLDADGTLTIARVSFAEADVEQARVAVRDLADWARHHGKAMVLADDAFAQAARTEQVRGWLARRVTPVPTDTAVEVERPDLGPDPADDERSTERAVGREVRARGLRPLLETLSERQRLLITYLDHGTTRGFARLCGVLGMPAPSKSAASREFVAASRELLAEVTSRSLADVKLAAIVLDGTSIGGRARRAGRKQTAVRKRTVVWALGITTDGEKIVLGVVEGVSENARLVGKLFDNLRARGLDRRDALHVIDGHKALATAIKEADRREQVDGEPPWCAAVQRCRVHAARNVVHDNLPREVREAIGDEVRRRLWSAWDTPHLATAAARLRAIERWLERGGHEAAAESLRGVAALTLTLQRLGVNHRKLFRTLGNTNVLESVHRSVGRWKRKQSRWQRPPSDMALRVVVAALANAELGWSPVSERAALEELTLAVVRARHPTIALRCALEGGDRVTLARLAFAADDAAGAQVALEDVLRWADWHGKAVVVGDRALEDVPDPEALRSWLRERGFVARDAVSEPELMRMPAGGEWSHAELVGRLREAAGEERALGVVDWAGALAPGAVGATPQQLAAATARLEAACVALGSVEGAVSTWWDAHRDRAAHELARGGPEALGAQRRLVLGAARARELEGAAAYLVARGPVTAEGGSVLAELDGLAAPARAMAYGLAANGELRRRQQFEAARAESHARSSAPARASAAVPPDHALGARRVAQQRRYAAALAPSLRALDAEALEALQAEVGEPWTELVPASAVRTVRLEDRDRVDAERRYVRAKGEQGAWERRVENGTRVTRAGAQERADAARHDASAAWTQLGEIDAALAAERAREGSLDRLALEHPDAPLAYAIQAEQSRRIEQDRDLAPTPEAEVAVTVPEAPGPALEM